MFTRHQSFILIGLIFVGYGLLLAFGLLLNVYNNYRFKPKK